MAYDETDTCWHIMTVTNGGTVSILKNLDAQTAREAYQRLRNNSAWNNYSQAQHGGQQTMGISSGQWDRMFKEITVLGPEGVELFPERARPKETRNA